MSEGLNFVDDDAGAIIYGFRVDNIRDEALQT